MGAALKVICSIVLGFGFIAVLAAAILKQQLAPAAMAPRLPTTPVETVVEQGTDLADKEATVTTEQTRPGRPAQDLGAVQSDLDSAQTRTIDPTRQQNNTRQSAESIWQAKLADEQARSAGLDHDLGAARADLADARKQGEEAARQQSAERQSIEASWQAKLAAEEAKSAGLDHDLGAARADLADARKQGEEAARQQGDERQTIEVSWQAKLAAEEAKSAALDHDLGAARADLADARKQGDGAAARQQGDERQSIEASWQAKLAAEEARSAGLDHDLGAARADLADARKQGEEAARQLSVERQAIGASWEAKLSDQQARSAKLDHDLVDARTRLAEMERQQTEARQSSEAGLRAADDKARSDQQAAEGLEARRADAERRTLAVQAELRDEQMRSAALARDLETARTDLARARAAQTEAVRQPPAPGATSEIKAAANGAQHPLQAPEATTPQRVASDTTHQPPSLPSPAPSGLDAHAPLPTLAQVDVQDRKSASLASIAKPLTTRDPDLMPGHPAHVILRYVRRSDKAHARAIALSLALRDKGFAVAAPVGTASVIPATTLSFFYDEDQVEAERLAEILAMPRPVRGSLSVDDPLPRPGTIEIILGG